MDKLPPCPTPGLPLSINAPPVRLKVPVSTRMSPERIAQLEQTTLLNIPVASYPDIVVESLALTTTPPRAAAPKFRVSIIAPFVMLRRSTCARMPSAADDRIDPPLSIASDDVQISRGPPFVATVLLPEIETDSLASTFTAPVGSVKLPL